MYEEDFGENRWGMWIKGKAVFGERKGILEGRIERDAFGFWKDREAVDSFKDS